MKSFHGYLDTIDANSIVGWAAESEDGHFHATELCLFINGEAGQKFIPSIYRPDLEEAQIGQGAFGFELTLENAIDPTTIKLEFSNGDLLPLSDDAKTSLRKRAYTLPDEKIEAPKNISVDGLVFNARYASLFE